MICHYILSHLTDKNPGYSRGLAYNGSTTVLHSAAKAGLTSVVKEIVESVSEKLPLDGESKSPTYYAILGKEVCNSVENVAIQVVEFSEGGVQN